MVSCNTFIRLQGITLLTAVLHPDPLCQMLVPELHCKDRLDILICLSRLQTYGDCLAIDGGPVVAT